MLFTSQLASLTDARTESGERSREVAKYDGAGDDGASNGPLRSTVRRIAHGSRSNDGTGTIRRQEHVWEPDCEICVICEKCGIALPYNGIAASSRPLESTLPWPCQCQLVPVTVQRGYSVSIIDEGLTGTTGMLGEQYRIRSGCYCCYALDEVKVAVAPTSIGSFIFCLVATIDNATTERERQKGRRGKECRTIGLSWAMRICIIVVAWSCCTPMDGCFWCFGSFLAVCTIDSSCNGIKRIRRQISLRQCNLHLIVFLVVNMKWSSSMEGMWVTNSWRTTSLCTIVIVCNNSKSYIKYRDNSCSWRNYIRSKLLALNYEIDNMSNRPCMATCTVYKVA